MSTTAGDLSNSSAALESISVEEGQDANPEKSWQMLLMIPKPYDAIYGEEELISKSHLSPNKKE